MKTALNRIFYYLTGVLASARTGTFTAGSGSLSYAYFVVGWDSFDGSRGQIPLNRLPVCVIDLSEGIGERKEFATAAGWPNGVFDKYMTFSFELLVQVNTNGTSILGRTGEKGILDFYDDVQDRLFGTQDAMQLVYSGSPYANEISYPINVEEGAGIDETGRVWARARRFDVTYRKLVGEY